MEAGLTANTGAAIHDHLKPDLPILGMRWGIRWFDEKMYTPTTHHYPLSDHKCEVAKLREKDYTLFDGQVFSTGRV